MATLTDCNFPLLLYSLEKNSRSGRQKTCLTSSSLTPGPSAWFFSPTQFLWSYLGCQVKAGICLGGQKTLLDWGPCRTGLKTTATQSRHLLPARYRSVNDQKTAWTKKQKTRAKFFTATNILQNVWMTIEAHWSSGGDSNWSNIFK